MSKMKTITTPGTGILSPQTRPLPPPPPPPSPNLCQVSAGQIPAQNGAKHEGEGAQGGTQRLSGSSYLYIER